MNIKKYILFALMVLCCWQADAQRYYEVVAKQLDMMNAPTLDGQVLGQLKEHDLVQVVRTSKGWATIKYENAQAFVVLAGLQAVDDDETSSGGTSGSNSGSLPQTGNTPNTTNQSSSVAVEIVPTKVKITTLFGKMKIHISFMVNESVNVDYRTFIPAGSMVEVEVLSDGWERNKYEITGGDHSAYKQKKSKEQIRQEVRDLVIRPIHIALPSGRKVPIQVKKVRVGEFLTLEDGNAFQILKSICSPFTVYVTPERAQ